MKRVVVGLRSKMDHIVNYNWKTTAIYVAVSLESIGKQIGCMDILLCIYNKAP